MTDSTDTRLPMYFEDFFEGQTLTSSKDIITQERVEAFAFAGGDNNPLHLDSEYAAKRIPFRKRIIHGELAASVITALGAKLVGFESIMLHIETSAKFVHPVYAGDTVHAVMVVVKAEDAGKRYGLVSLSGELINQNGTIVAAGTRELMIFKRPKAKGNE